MNDKEPKKFDEIWANLSKVDVSNHIEKKGGLSYLSWAWAWGVLMEHYPNAYYSHPTCIHDEHSSTAMVWVSVVIEGSERSMWLPVMDYKNKAIVNPTSRDISDTSMRCLVKCLAMFGLGHYIYAGEDLPQQPERTAKKAEKPDILDTYKSLLMQSATNGGTKAFRATWKDAGSTVAKDEAKRCKDYISATPSETEWMETVKSVCKEIDERLKAEAV